MFNSPKAMENDVICGEVNVQFIIVLIKKYYVIIQNLGQKVLRKSSTVIQAFGLINN